MTVSAILTDPDYAALKSFVLQHTGLAYYSDKDEDLATRLSRRMSALKVPDCSTYLDILNRPANTSEIDALAGELTIGETYFFRQREHFELIRSKIIPDLIERNQTTRQMRIWSAGCATGAEPYSVAMLLQSEFAEPLRDWNIFILGTDINPDFLAQARAGRYSEWALRDVPLEDRECCFLQAGNRWILNREFRDAVTFRHHNLADGSAIPSADGAPFDLILCRNVLIYFSADQTRAVLLRFRKSLATEGWLLVGHAECGADALQQFAVVREPNVIAFRKNPEDLAYDGRSEEPLAQWQPWVDHSFNPPENSSANTAAIRTTPVAADPSFAPPQPASASARLEEARALADRGEWNAAASICQELLSLDPLNAAAHFTLGLILAHTSSLEEAKTELRSAIYVDRRFALAYYHLGTLLQRSRSFPEARRSFRNVLQLLEGRAADDPLEHGDGIKVEELRALTRMHEEVLGE